MVIKICRKVREAEEGKRGEMYRRDSMELKRKTFLYSLGETSNFVCTELHVSIRHYLETTFLEEADVSTVSFDAEEDEETV